VELVRDIVDMADLHIEQAFYCIEQYRTGVLYLSRPNFTGFEGGAALVIRVTRL
jgi:hypothetical protein